MKLYKFLAPTLMLGSVVGFTSCNSEEDDIFNASAAERLDEYKKVYSADLTAQGGRWLMEYFPNEEDRGYVFAMTFNPDGSVKIAGHNVWLNKSYKSDVSMWSVIADDGPVLSFNTYNQVFHLFSTPENITGEEAPTNPDNDNKDIDETGEGHAGDYEFVILGLSEDGNTMKLAGKKRNIPTFMHRLSETDDEQLILSDYYNAAYSTFNASFPNYFITDTNTGEKFEVKGGVSGKFEFWPVDGDPVTQTVSINALIGPDGIRMRAPLAIERGNATDSIVVENFVKQPDGKYLCKDNDQNLVLDCIGLGNIFCIKDYIWHLDNNKSGGKFAEYFDEIAAKSKSALKLTFKGFDFLYSQSNKKFALNFKRSGSKADYFFFGNETVVDDGDAIKFSYSTTDVDVNGGLLLQRVPIIGEFIAYLNSCDFEFVPNSRFAPTVIRMVDKTNPENFLYVTLNK